jgi:hypothetical protein
MILVRECEDLKDHLVDLRWAFEVETPVTLDLLIAAPGDRLDDSRVR